MNVNPATVLREDTSNFGDHISFFVATTHLVRPAFVPAKHCVELQLHPYLRGNKEQRTSVVHVKMRIAGAYSRLSTRHVFCFT